MVSFRDSFVRHSEGVSIVDIANATGISKHQLYKLKQRETATTNVEDAIKIARYFGMSLDDFLNESSLKPDIEITSLAQKLPDPLLRELLTFGRGLAAAEDRDNQSDSEEL